MSFPRAKIQRFNDTKSCAPPPGSYDPKLEAKVKGAVIEKSERFTEHKCLSQSSNSGESPGNLSLTSSSGKSVSFNCLPVFRTPQLPRKHVKQMNSVPQVKSKLKFEQKTGSTREVDAEMYDALLVDRNNKDATIKENEAHIDELYECIRKLEQDLQQIKSEREELQKKNEEEIGEILQKLEVQNKEMTALKLELKKSNFDLLRAKETCNDLEKQLGEKELSLLGCKQYKEDLVLEIKNLKEKEIEYRSNYEMNVKELNDHYKGLEKELAELRVIESLKEELKEEMDKVKENLAIISDSNSDLNCKLNQKQQLILWLQGELSSIGLELEECKSENEKMSDDFKQERESLISKYESEIEEKQKEVEDLRKIIADERERNLQEVQTLQENIMNGSVVRENLESNISEKKTVLSALNDKYTTLETLYEESCLQHKKAEDTLNSELSELRIAFEEKNE
ncbi:hypothetical protein L9F63_001796 [Diploptera punctata]|uniref:Hyaluronan mediated motility receptor n=1 Tax=Diploptera punctata TaxID=6984 RepID=A0AAD8A3C9_DIPPU|nr:hypothetical protein L9F63_001796 [Diploptera punctata]